jgi:hypothetical protein
LASCKTGEWQRCAGFKGQPGRQHGNACDWGRREFRIGALAVERQLGNHAVARGEAGDARPCRRDRACHVEPDDSREVQRDVGGEKALPHIEIGRVEAGGRDPDQHVAGAEDRVWSVLEPELIDIAVGLETDSFHGRLRSSGFS